MGKKRNIIITSELEPETPVSGSVVISNPPALSLSKGKSPTKSKTRGKLYTQAKKLVDPNRQYSIEEAVQLVKQISFSKKSNTVEAHINLGLDLTKNEHKIRTKEIKVEKSAPIVHTIIGKVDFDDKQLVENFKALMVKIKEVRPAKIKGVYIRSVYLASSMSPSIKVAL